MCFELRTPGPLGQRLRTELRDGREMCDCGCPLSQATEIKRSYRLIRWGEFQGSRGEFLLLRCAQCRREARILWSVTMPSTRRAA